MNKEINQSINNQSNKMTLYSVAWISKNRVTFMLEIYNEWIEATQNSQSKKKKSKTLQRYFALSSISGSMFKFFFFFKDL